MQKIISILLFVIFIFNSFYVCLSEDFKLCADSKCSEPLSLAKTKIMYNGLEKFSLPFPKGVTVKVFSKLKGSKDTLWGVELYGQKGYVPLDFLKEIKKFLEDNKLVKVAYNIPDDSFPVIPIQNGIKTDIPIGVTGDTPIPQNVLSPHEVVEGTTIYLNPEDNIIASTDKIVESTFSPDFKSNDVDVEDWDLEYNDVRTETISEIVEKDSSEDLEIESKNLPLSDENNLNILETPNTNTENNLEPESPKIKTIITEFENNVTISSEASNVDETKFHTSEDKDNEIESTSKISVDESNEVLLRDTEIQNPLLNINSEFKSNEDGSIETNNDGKVINSNDVKSDDSTLNLESNNTESVEILNNDVPLDSKVNVLNVIESIEYSTSMKVNPNPNTIDNINDPRSFDSSETIDVTTDNTTVEEISEIKNEKQSLENVISSSDKKDSQDSPIENDPKKQQDNILENSSDRQSDNTTVENISENKNEQQSLENVISSSDKKDSQDNPIENDPKKQQDNILENSSDRQSDNTTVENISENKNEQQSLENVISSSDKQDSQVNPIGSDSEKQHDYILENSSGRQSDNTTEENISENKYVISSPELTYDSILSNKQDSQDNPIESNSEKQNDNILENFSQSSEAIDVSDSPNKFDSHNFPNSINILDQLSNNLPQNSIESQEDVTNSEEQFHFENSDEKKDDSSNLFNANIDDNVVTENSIHNVRVESEEKEISDVMSDVNLEKADFLTTVYEFFGIYQSKEPEVEIEPVSDFNNHESRSILGNNEEVYSKKEEYVCKNTNSENIYSLQQFEIPESTYGIIIYLTITAITVLIFTLGYYYIEKLRQDGTLVKRINELEKALLNSNKEKNILRNELELSQGAEAPISLLEKLRDELEESNRLRIELEEQNVNLERELETATEAGLELNKMLGEYLSSQQSGNLVEESLEYLQKQLNDQQLTIAEMTISANEKSKEFETNLVEFNTAKEKITELTSELNSLVVNFTKLQEDSYARETQLNEQITILKTELEKEINEKNHKINEKNTELNQIKQLSKELQHNLNVKENELLLLKENLHSMNESENSIESVIDNTHIRAELKEVHAEKELLTKQLDGEMEQKKLIENQLSQMITEKDNLHIQLQNVEKEKIETQTRLEVLSAYFKEKETQLQKELAKHEELWSQNQGQANSTVERIKLLQEEIQNYKSQNELLRNEIVDQEVSLKSQISVMEKKNHENWLLLRQTERRLEESKHECSQLRNRLTIVEKNLNSEDKSQFRVVSPPLNGDISTSPIHMIEPPVSSPLLFPHRDNMPTTPPINFMGLPPPPPPPGALPFMPPPPPGVPFMPPPPALFPGDRRPPPLGRMSSPPPPPPPNTFSPPRTFSPYDQDRDSPPIRDRMYNLYDNDNNYRHRSPPPFAPLPPPHADQVKDWENRQSFRPIDQQRPTNRSKTNLNSNEFV